MTEEEIVCCTQVEDLPTPPVASTKALCALCGAKVWLADSTPRKPTIWCMRCFADHLESNEGPINIAVPTPEQMRDILGWRGRQ